MDRNKKVSYYDNKSSSNCNFINKEEVVKMVAIPQPREVNLKTPSEKTNSKIIKKQRKSALEISESIGVYGAFGRTLSDLHKQGK